MKKDLYNREYGLDSLLPDSKELKDEVKKTLFVDVEANPNYIIEFIEALKRVIKRFP